ncbi:EAL domain-containing response regulator [Catenovulum sp. SM1970]|uniref:EAL domain-containing response regulator n=1 Tax=Marinifaba aquimaris TaxID=2741323 RepID=UPI001573E9B4|nr:EAL domain-containing response regulator [Marinifaba aquimaris]NTS78913.1 EAL domain-containing response regulator [Marinifaba aquimaris]
MNIGYRNVVAIDDDSFSLSFIKEQLQQAGFESIFTYTNPELALEDIISQTIPADLVILDLQMPEMDGIRALRLLGEASFKGSIIIYSGFEQKILALAEQIACENELTILGSLPKPFTLKQLENLLESHSASPDIDAISESHRFCITNGELVLTRQPQYCLNTGRIVSYEILSRWRNNSGAILPPAVFIPKLEDEGEIHLFQEMLFDLAMRKISEADDNLIYSINLSMRCMDKQDVPDLVAKSASKYNVSLDRIILEVTESSVADDMLNVKETLTRLCLMGVTLSIDDFGTGYSTLDKLCDLPFKEVKLDRRYVSGCDQSTEKQAIIKSTVEIAQSMGLRTVAEGMETAEEADVVATLCVDVAQGFYFSKPQMWN